MSSIRWIIEAITECLGTPTVARTTSRLTTQQKNNNKMEQELTFNGDI